MGRFRGVELDDLELAGPRLRLRPWRADDAEIVHAALRDDVDAHRFTSLPVPYTRADADRFVTEIGNAGRADGTVLGGALVSADGVVGSADLRLTENGELGYLVYSAHRGHGYAAEAARLLAEWAFARGLPRVHLLCRVDNVASVRTALAAGFRFEGVHRAMTLRNADERAPARVADMARFGRVAADRAERVPYAFPPLPSEGLSDGVLRLRPLRAEDATGLAGTDDELTLRWNFTGTAHDPDEARRSAEQAELMWLAGSVAAVALVDIATGRFAGELRLRKAGPPQVCGIGYVVHPDFRGRGYTARALRLLVPWAFDVAGAARLELGAKAGNEASLRAAAAAGFEPDGVRAGRLRNADGSFSDEVRYVLLNPNARRAGRSAPLAGEAKPR